MLSVLYIPHNGFFSPPWSSTPSLHPLHPLWHMGKGSVRPMRSRVGFGRVRFQCSSVSRRVDIESVCLAFGIDWLSLVNQSVSSTRTHPPTYPRPRTHGQLLLSALRPPFRAVASVRALKKAEPLARDGPASKTDIPVLSLGIPHNASSAPWSSTPSLHRFCAHHCLARC